MAVGNGLSPCRQVGLHTQMVPAAVALNTKAGADVVDNQQRILFVAELACSSRIGRIRQLLIDEDIVLEGRGEDGGQIIASLRHRILQAFYVIVLIINEVSAVFFHRPGRDGRAPGRCAMIGPARHQNLLASPIGPRRQQRHAGGVRAVLAEHCPVGMRDHRHEGFGQFHHARRRPRRHVNLRHLLAVSGVHLLVAVAEEIGSIAAHEIDIAVSIDIPEIGAFRTLEELRRMRRQQADGLMPVHTARNNPVRPRSQFPIDLPAHHASPVAKI